MSPRRVFVGYFAAILLFVASSVTQAADVLRHVPDDALGFLVVRNLERVDSNVARLAKDLQLPLPAPLAFLKASTGIGDGLNRQGDFLLAVLPSDKQTARPFFAVWLPVTDYDRFLSSLEGVAGDRISAITLAGEDLLVAKQGGWALMMDPERRTRMERILSSANASRRLTASAGWQSWIDGNDVTAVLLPGGIRAVWSFAAGGDASDNSAVEVLGGQPLGELFGPPAEGKADGDRDGENRSPANSWRFAQQELREAAKEWPLLSELAQGASALACGARLDDAGNATGGVRATWRREVLSDMDTWGKHASNMVVPFLRREGDFIVAGGGAIPHSVSAAVGGGYARYLMSSLEYENRDHVPPRDKERFIEAVEHAAGDVMSAAVLTLPSERQEGVYTNRFASVRVKSATEFVGKANEVVRLWNEINHDAEGEIRLVFDANEIQIAGRNATEHSIDMTAAMGTPGVPEIRQAMEKLFGPEGKLRLIFVKVDEETILLAGATREQTASALKLLSSGPARWDETNLGGVNPLLRSDDDWRVFFSPHGYTTWLERQTNAVVGPVIGGPIVPDFPETPPIGAAGGFDQRELWFEIAVPVETIRGAAAYLQQ